PTSRLPAAPKSFNDLLGFPWPPPFPVAADHPAIAPFLLTALPPDAKLVFRRPRLDRIDRSLTDPLEFGALAIAAFDHRCDAIGVHLSNHNENPLFVARPCCSCAVGGQEARRWPSACAAPGDAGAIQNGFGNPTPPGGELA